MANMSSISINKRADDQFKKLTRTEDGNKRPTEYEVRADALSTKIARLKALRLARDAVLRAAPPPAPVKKAGKTKSARPNAAAGPKSRKNRNPETLPPDLPRNRYGRASGQQLPKHPRLQPRIAATIA